MSRSGYNDNDDSDYPLALWRGAVASSIRGKRGQALLRETLAALDAMPVKELTTMAFEADGKFCTLGVVGAKRGVDLKPFIDDADVYDDGPTVNHDALARTLDVAAPLVREIMYENDRSSSWTGDEVRVETEICGPLRWYENRVRIHCEPVPGADARRWRRMRAWVAENIRPEPTL